MASQHTTREQMDGIEALAQGACRTGCRGRGARRGGRPPTQNICSDQFSTKYLVMMHKQQIIITEI